MPTKIYLLTPLDIDWVWIIRDQLESLATVELVRVAQKVVLDFQRDDILQP